MNNNRLTASKSKAALEEQSYDLIQQHIIDPENSPLPVSYTHLTLPTT